MLMFRVISLTLIFIGALMAVLVTLIARKNNNKPKRRKDGHNFCVLIPARYESKVIEGLLKSIKNQTHKVKMTDVYVVVESEKDETVNICKKYNATVFIRKELHLKRKGYALDEVVKYILSGKKRYDAYFIFDADNVLDKDYFKNMIPVFDKGYDLATGYRNCKNGNDSVVAASSALTFSLVNEVFNDSKNRKTRNITFSGTGFYIRGYLIEKWQGYPFHTLTEDYELSSYATLNNLTTYYNTKSFFYDEQPVKFKNTINQRIRWIRGYFDVRRMYQKKMLLSLDRKDPNFGSKLDESFGIIPYIFMVVGLLVWFLSIIFFIVYNLFLNKEVLRTHVLELLIYFVILYLALFIMTLVIVIIEGNKIDLSLKTKIKVLFYNPIFMISYVPCAIKALTAKEVKWTKVEHGK
jgi:cellulose synthase/poly-beta-1,6-N-acetylglucosamine synthase-like glycosyltransferase